MATGGLVRANREFYGWLSRGRRLPCPKERVGVSARRGLPRTTGMPVQLQLLAELDTKDCRTEKAAIGARMTNYDAKYGIKSSAVAVCREGEQL